uniref:DNA polymerase zeta catalytic subunit n=1 Tax=Plectus sambesii TaxID=2011161 RepID=A0A914VBT0_9BILA
MLRMTRKENYVAPSPSPVQRNRMAAPECIALTMEPESRLYTDPVLVLDFQSLYPSVVIAYNYCYSTCLGKISNMDHLPRMPLGCVGYEIPVKALKDIVAKREYHISPAGVAFVTSKVRRGILPRMLDEILNTRIMVKRRMSMYKNDPALTKLLDARQLALKLIANVTYGYTSANWSGRM